MATQAYSDTFHFFGVFDGHGGPAAAVHCTKNLHQHFVAALRKESDKQIGDTGQAVGGQGKVCANSGDGREGMAGQATCCCLT